MNALRIEHGVTGVGPFRERVNVSMDFFDRIQDIGNSRILSPYEDFGTSWSFYIKEHKDARFAFASEDLFWEFTSDILNELILFGFKVIEYTLDDSKILKGRHNIVFTEEAILKKETILE